MTANFRDFEVYDIHMEENIVVIRVPRACGDEPSMVQDTRWPWACTPRCGDEPAPRDICVSVHSWTLHMRG